MAARACALSSPTRQLSQASRHSQSGLSPSGTGQSLVGNAHSHRDWYVNRIHRNKCRDVTPKPRHERLLKIVTPDLEKHHGCRSWNMPPRWQMSDHIPGSANFSQIRVTRSTLG